MFKPPIPNQLDLSPTANFVHYGPKKLFKVQYKFQQKCYTSFVEISCFELSTVLTVLTLGSPLESLSSNGAHMVYRDEYT